MKTKRKYWLRHVFMDKPCEESKKSVSILKLRRWMSGAHDARPEIRMSYLMTMDPWGECFVDLIRNENRSV
jgi:hypothetical protein